MDQKETPDDGLKDEPIDWRERELRRKHAKLQKAKRENEQLRQLLDQHGIPLPPTEDHG